MDKARVGEAPVTYPSATLVLERPKIAVTASNGRYLAELNDQNANPVVSRHNNKSCRISIQVRRHGRALEAFEQMLLASRAKFVALAYSILRNREDAEDAVQNALLSAYLHLRAFEGRSALRTWFTRIVLNAALMIRRKRKLSRFVPLVDPDSTDDRSTWEHIAAAEPTAERAYGDKEALQRIEAELAKMRPALRQAFAITYYGELSRREACALLGVSMGTFKARLFRAKRLVVSGVSPRSKKAIRFSRLQNDLRTSTPALNSRPGLEVTVP